MQYQLAPLLSELDSFDVYLVDGRYRVACVCVAFLHASKYQENKSSVSVLLHDYRERPIYHAVEEFASVIETTPNGKLVRLQRKFNSTDEDIFNVWKRFRAVAE